MYMRDPHTLNLSIIIHLMLIIRLLLIFFGSFLVEWWALALPRILIVEAFAQRRCCRDLTDGIIGGQARKKRKRW